MRSSRSAFPAIRPLAWVIPVLAVVLLVNGIPALEAIWTSLTNAMYFRVEAARFVGLSNYVRLLKDPAFADSLGKSAVFVFGSLICALPLGVGLGFLANAQVPLVGVFRALLIVPLVTSQTITAYLWKWFLDPSFGPFAVMYGRVFGHPVALLSEPLLAMVVLILANVWMTFPIPFLITLSALQSVPVQLQDAASVEGAGRWQRFRFVTLPFIQNSLLVAALLQSVQTFNLVTLAYTLTGGGPGVATRTVSIHVFQLAFQDFQSAVAAALSCIMLLGNIAASLVYIRIMQTQVGV